MIVKRNRPAETGRRGGESQLVCLEFNEDLSTSSILKSTISGRACDYLLPHIAQAARMAATDPLPTRRKKHTQLKNFLAALVRFSVGRSYTHEASNV